MSSNHKKSTVDLVIPVFNEAGVVEQTHARICAVIDDLPYEFTFYYVDDGSSDDEAFDGLLQLCRNLVAEIAGGCTRAGARTQS